MKVDLKDIEFEEAYVVESIKQGKRTSIFERDKDIEFEAIKNESEDNDYLVQMKLKIYYEKIRNEEHLKAKLYNEQRSNLHRIGIYCLFMVIFSLLIVLIEKFAHLSLYIKMSDISIMDLKSVGVLLIYPVTILFVIGIVVSFAWVIVLLKRSAITIDPHDSVKRRRETIIKKCDDRIQKYNDEIYRLNMKLLNIR